MPHWRNKMAERKVLSAEEKIAHHSRMAEGYHQAYEKIAVKDGATYDAWVFADDAVYWSPYFGDNLIDLKTNPMTVKQSATMEALTYSLTLPDWKPLGFKYWAGVNGFAMQSHYGGHDAEGHLHDFYAYGFVDTNEYGEITRWETHCSPEYNDFLDFTIGIHGPFKNGADEYMYAVMKKLSANGVGVKKLMSL